MRDPVSSNDMLDLVAEIVAAHVAHNKVAVDVLPGLIQKVYGSLKEVSEPAHIPDKPSPAVPVKKSIFPDYLICLEDGKKLKMLTRHLKSTYNMTPKQYRERWGLMADYPMIAPNYASHRSSLAKLSGLGTKANRRQ